MARNGSQGQARRGNNPHQTRNREHEGMSGDLRSTLSRLVDMRTILNNQREGRGESLQQDPPALPPQATHGYPPIKKTPHVVGAHYVSPSTLGIPHAPQPDHCVQYVTSAPAAPQAPQLAHGVQYVTQAPVAPYVPQAVVGAYYSLVVAIGAPYTPPPVTLNHTPAILVALPVLPVGEITIETPRAMIMQINEENKGVPTGKYRSPVSIEIRTAPCLDRYQVTTNLWRRTRCLHLPDAAIFLSLSPAWPRGSIRSYPRIYLCLGTT